MTLAHRLSVFFLAALGVVLGALTVGVPLATHLYLHRQTNRALAAGLNTLVAAIEVAPDGVEWEPAERNLVIDRGPLGQEVSWVLFDDRGRQIDGTYRDAERAALLSAAKAYSVDSRANGPQFRDEQSWKIAQQWLTPARLHPELVYYPDQDPKHRALGVTAAIDTSPIATVVRVLAIGLLTASTLLWLVVLFLGQRISRRILGPITRLAQLAGRLQATDLTERVAVMRTGDELESLAAAFNGLLDRLQESFQRQERFTGDAAHQLRTPLTAILGQTEVALRRPRSPAEYQELLAKVHRQSLHLRDIVESLLFLARTDDQTLPGQLEPVEFSAWLVPYLSEWQSQHPQALLESTIPKQDCFIRAQKVLLGELVNVVLDNAIKYREPGTPIALRLECLPGCAWLTIENVCAGRAEDPSQFFEPFYRSASARLRGVDGLGLGLTIARRLAATFGGRITARSVDGRVRFTIELPLVKPESQPQAPCVEQRSHSSDESDRGAECRQPANGVGQAI